MPQLLRDLRIDRVDLVDAPASKGARIVLFKRDGGGAPASDYVDIEKLDSEKDHGFAPEVVAYLKRQFSDKERKKDAKAGIAMPNGGFPIENKKDLDDAMQAIGRAKNPGKAKAHIRSRAKALGLTGELSDAFKSAQERIEIGKLSFDEAYANGEAQENVSDMLDELFEMINALQTANAACRDDATVTDKAAALSENLDQFQEAVGELMADGVEKAIAAGIVAAASPSTMETAMSADLRKALGLPEKATDAEITAAVTKMVTDVAKLTVDLNKASMSQKHQDYAEAAEMNGDQKTAFAAKTPAERDAHMEKNPVNKAADETLVIAGGATIRKSKVGEGVFEVLKAQQAQLTKQADDIAKAAEKDALTVIEKRVTPLRAVGKAEDLAAMLRTVEKIDPKTAAEIEKVFGTLNERVLKAGLFAERGGNAPNGETGGTAAAQIQSLADELRKKDPKLTIEKARIEVRKTNSEFAKRESAEARATVNSH